MRTVATESTTKPFICLATDSEDDSLELEARLSGLGCTCEGISSLLDLQHILENNAPQLIVLSLDVSEQCALEYCQAHSELLSSIPVVFLAEDPTECFEKSLEAIRLGAADVLTPPFDFEKLERIAAIARQQLQGRPNAAAPKFRLGKGLNTPHVAVTHSPSALGSNRSYVPSDRSRYSSTQGVPSLRRPSSGLESLGSRPLISGDTPSSSHRDAHAPCPKAMARSANHASGVQELEKWILGSSPAMQSVRATIAEVAETKANVMIYGASGTGKELVATAVHKLSNRSSGRFEPVNMTEIPHDLAESLLFGHERGAFTGADYRQIGVCEAADGGTLFLDEIGEMALATQPKLLRFLQEGTVKRIGSQTIKKVDVRVITATNRSPETIVKEGLMREDLFFRLHVVPIHIPPLHERPEDIEQLANLFLRRYVKAYDRNVEGFTTEALDIFRLHEWPGNVRQLENVVERLVVFAKGRLIDVPDIPSEIHAASMFGDSPHRSHESSLNSVFAKTASGGVDGQDSETAAAIASMSAIQRTERAAITEALLRCDGHVIDAANLLGLGQATVYRKIKQYHIPHERRRRRRSPK